MMRASSFPASIVVYGLSILLTKGFTLISMPLIAAYLTPADFGDLDLATSVVEFAGLIASLGLADMLYRFAAVAEPEQRRSETAEIAATALVAGICLVIVSQIAAPALWRILGIGLSLLSFRAGLAAAALSGLITLPLAWLRLNGRPMAYLGFVAVRSLAQIGLVWLLLARGFGAESVFYSTAVVHTAAAVTMVATMAARDGLRLRPAAFRRLASYGLPLVGAGLAMFALGSADRWFLAAIPRSELAHYAVAVKLSLAVSLVIQPVMLWWGPQRLAVLIAPGGIARNRRVFLAAFAILSGGTAAVVLAMPIFARWALPPAYAPALALLPALAFAVALNELVALSNAGAYLGRSSWPVLGVNIGAAIVALAGYAALAPVHGVGGVIAATILAQTLRLAAFMALSRRTAPTPLFSWQTALLAAAALAPVLYARDAGAVIQIAALAALPFSIMAAAFATGVAPHPSRLYHAVAS